MCRNKFGIEEREGGGGGGGEAFHPNDNIDQLLDAPATRILHLFSVYKTSRRKNSYQ